MTVTEEYDYDARAEAPATGLVPGMGVAVGRDASGYGYDADGNMLTYGGWTLGWNGENRLVLASNGATRVTFAYDSMGRRFLKAVGATTNRYTYDGWAMIREADGSRTNDYAYGLDLSGSPQGAGTIGGLLMATLDGTNAFYCYDANGNVTELVDGGGNTVAAYRYDPFGNTIGKSGTLADANPFRFSTKYLDGETDLYYYGYRFYSP
jgi:YD repeat-containing protein